MTRADVFANTPSAESDECGSTITYKTGTRMSYIHRCALPAGHDGPHDAKVKSGLMWFNPTTRPDPE